MKNLVSKNPIQRFKQDGNQIILGYNPPNRDNNFSLVSSAKYIGYNPPNFNGNMMYNLPNLDSNNISNNSSEDNLQIQSKQKNLQVSQKKSNEGKSFSRSEKSNTSLINPIYTLSTTPVNQEIINFGPFIANPTGRRKITKKVSILSPVFAGHRIGRTGGLNYNINDTDKQQLIRTGQFTESDFTNARATQQALNRYFANSGLGSVKEDNAWGDQSRAALALALAKSKSLTPFNNETTLVKPAYTPSTTPINQEVVNLEFPQQIYDRAGVREFIRNKGINPYSFNGAQRRALRMVLNNTADDNDKLLVKGMKLFKQGGQLVSRKPIERFKQRNFR